MHGPPVTPQPPPGPLEERVLGVPASERATERAKIHREYGAPAPWFVTIESTEYRLSMPFGVLIVGYGPDDNNPRMWPGLGYGSLYVPRVSCTPDPPSPVDPEGYVFVNPPIKVWDGTVHEQPDPVTGDTTLVANFGEDPQEALRQMVAKAVFGDLYTEG